MSALRTKLMMIAVGLAGLATLGASDARTTVERIRYIGTVSYSRVVIDLSAPAEYRTEFVPSQGESVPNRLVIDVSGAKVGPEAREPLRIRDPMLRDIRTGQYAADTARIVLDLTAVAQSRVFVLPDPYRLVIDLKGRGVPGESGPGDIRRLDSGQTTAKRGSRETAAEPAPAATVSREKATVPAESPRETSKGVSSPPGAQRPQIGERPEVAERPVEASARRLKVLIDPGHGGKDPGAQANGLDEKDVVLAIAKLLAERLRAEAGVDVSLTRSDDRFLSLEERTGLANAEAADLFVSIHANASLNPALRGIEVYYLNNTNNRATLRLAAMENNLRWDPHNPRLQAAIPDLSYILSDLRQTYKVEESRQLAEQLQRSLVGRLGDAYDSIEDLGVKEGPFYVLVGAYMPCVLAEVSFLTNPVDGSRLGTQSYRRSVADGIYDGIRNYIAQTKLAKTL